MQSKVCFKCNTKKPLSEYYKHSKMGDGHLGKCIDCTKNDVKIRERELRKNPKWIENEKRRAREKYHRLGYKDKHKPSAAQKKAAMKRYHEKYPEKYLAGIQRPSLKNTLGENHHWSYNKEHYKDVIDITPKNHAKVHRYIIYDQERMMYRRIDTNELLDTKEKHLEWINYCIQHKED